MTGRRAFAGTDVTDTLAAVVRAEPEWHLLPDTMAPSVRVFMRRCLDKDPKQRIPDIAAMRLALEGAFETVVSQVAETVAVAQPMWRRGLPLVVTAAVVASLVVGLSMWAFLRPVPALPVRLSIVHPGEEDVGGNQFDANLAISPDGRHVAYVAHDGSAGNSFTLNLYVRALDQLEPTLLSTSARSPFFSPDGQWVGFVEDNDRLSRVPLTGGPSIPIGVTTNGFRGGSWGPDDSIVFATNAVATGLWQFSALGGDAEVLTTPDTAAGEVNHLFPEVLPGGARCSLPSRPLRRELITHRSRCLTSPPTRTAWCCRAEATLVTARRVTSSTARAARCAQWPLIWTH